MIALVKRVAWRFVPNAEMMWTLGLRLVIAAGAYTSARITGWAWLDLVAKLFAFMAVYGLCGLWEKQVVAHTRRAFELLGLLRGSQIPNKDENHDGQSHPSRGHG